MEEKQKVVLPLNPKAPEFLPASSKNPYFRSNNSHPSMFYPYQTFHPPLNKFLKPAKAFFHGDLKAGTLTRPFGRLICHRRNLPPRLVKKQEVLMAKNRDLSAKPVPVEDKVETFLAGKTSVMVRNIPNNIRRRDLLKILDTHCQDQNNEASVLASDEQENSFSSYDFLYLPMDFVHRANLGYAFVNFTSSIAAEKFRKSFDNFFWKNPGNRKVCKVTMAKFQGKEEFSQHFKNSKFPCHTDDYLPVVLSPPSDGFNGYNLKMLGCRVGLRGGGSHRA